MSGNLEKIAQLVDERKKLSDSLPALIAREKNWRLDSQKSCNYTLKAKREKCQAERNNSLKTADGILGDINNVKGKIAQIDIQIDTIKKSQSAVDQAVVTLAKSGQSMEALAIKANAEAQAIKTVADTAADNSKKQTTVIIAVVVVVVVVIGYFIYKKIKK